LEPGAPGGGEIYAPAVTQRCVALAAYSLGDSAPHLIWPHKVILKPDGSAVSFGGSTGWRWTPPRTRQAYQRRLV